ncbi:hypothetical protein OsccyDRAFT_0928 [Leptolyngbyaceae cyanobacterium JSC-12]|nr:hypothetical protein OsccyDRAFT_0928 [Leptolyngbyaceae cyanobacterium JSC-12]
MPLEEDANVVPIKQRPASQIPQGTLGSIAEDPLSPRSPTKRKQTGSGKGRATSKPKPAATYRAPQSAKHQLFADELQHLEELADRINQILAERARKKAWMEQSQSMSLGMEVDPDFTQAYGRSPQFPSDPMQISLEQSATEDLKQQAKRIRQRLSQLELMMDEADTPTMPSQNQQVRDGTRGYAARSPYSPPSVQQPAEPSYSHSSSYGHSQPHPNHNPFDPMRQRYEHEAWRANEELQHLIAQGQSYNQPEGYRDRIRQPAYNQPSTQEPQQPFEPTIRRSLSHLQRLPLWRFFELPDEPVERLKDAVIWIGLAAISRFVFRYFLSSLPFLSPVLTLMMLAPAALAIFLALFVPKTGWIPFYRLFLVMLGLFIGGKLF